MDVSVTDTATAGGLQGASQGEIDIENIDDNQQPYKQNQSMKSTPGGSFNRRKKSPGKEDKGKKQKALDEYEYGEEDKARAFFKCECMVCKEQVIKGHLFEIKKKTDMRLLTDTPAQFVQIIEWLFANSDKIKGAQVMFPDTVFFEDGKPSFIAKIDKEGCMQKITQPSKLSLQDIRQKFSQLVRDRRKDNGLLFFPTNPGAALLFKQTNNFMGEEIEAQNLMQQQTIIDREDKSDNKKDVVIIRYFPRNANNAAGFSPEYSPDYPTLEDSPDGAQPGIIIPELKPVSAQKDDNGDNDLNNIEIVKVAKDIDFINMFKMRANDPEWTFVNCIQTCIKARTIGVPLFVTFIAPINEALPKKEIEYGAHARMLPDDYELLKGGTPEDDEVYALKQCYKIAHFIQKVYQQEILQMKAEFLKDDNGNIWFYYASAIQIRSRLSKNGPQVITVGIDPAKAKALEAEEKEQLLEEITDYAKEEQQQNGCVNRIMGIMETYYSGIKADLGIAETQKLLLAEQDGQNDDVLKLDEVLKKLRPNCNAVNFKEFLLRQDNFNKNHKWKRISRKLHPNITKDSTANESSPSKNMMTQEQLEHNLGVSSQTNASEFDPRQQRLKIQQLLSNLDIQGGKQQLGQAIQSIKSSRQKLMSPQKQAIESPLLPKHQSNLSMTGPVQMSRMGEMRNRTFLKAELVKKQLINRGDFMKLYQPPIPVSSLPYNNPFYTKTIISHSAVEEEGNEGYYNQLSSPVLQKTAATPNQDSYDRSAIKSAGLPEGTSYTPYMNKRRTFQMTARTQHPQSQEGQRIASHSLFSMQNNIINAKIQQKQTTMMMDWSKFQGNKTLQKQIARRMEYLQMQDTFKPHQGIQDYRSSCATGSRPRMTPGQGSQYGAL